jgi:hypothetical protein
MPLAVVAPIISAAVAAAGAGYGIEQTSAAQNKMNQDVANTVGQEQQLQKQATPIYQQNLQKATSQQPAQQGIAQALQGYQRAAQAPVSTQPIVDAPPSKTVDARTAADVARQQQASAAVAQYPAQCWEHQYQCTAWKHIINWTIYCFNLATEFTFCTRTRNTRTSDW